MPKSSQQGKRRAALLAPVAVPVSMSMLFAALGRRMTPAQAYQAGFAVYWVGWCLAFPLWVLGPHRAAAVLRRGRALRGPEALIALVPVAGGAVTELWPQRRRIDVAVAAVLVGTAVVNAVGEELLWRGVYLEEFPGDVIRGALWPLAGFATWHFAPQIVLRSRLGRGRFVLGATIVGACSTVVAWRSGGVRPALLPHIATDACGVRASLFRLGR